MTESTIEQPVSVPKPEASPSKRPRAALLDATAGIGILILTGATFIYMPEPLGQPKGTPDSGLYAQSFLRLHAIYIGTFLAALLLTPAVQVGVERLRAKWRPALTCCALALTCLFVWVFIVHFGRRQFGAFDFNILIDMGWRQFLGQRPYVDFPATTPAGFNLGSKFAFELFGVTWDANLYWAAFYASATFLWIYGLMRRISAGRLASAAVAFAIECSGMLTLCFWWYNNSALVAAAVFFLACIAYALQPEPLDVQISYAASLALLSLMKPNIAGLTILCCLPLLFCLTTKKLRLTVLTGCSAAATLLFLAVNHIPVVAMITSFLSVAKSRGTITNPFGFGEMNVVEQHAAVYWIRVLSIPLLGLLPQAYRQIKARDWRGIGLAFMISISFLVAWYGLLTNGEFRDVECTLLLAAVGALAFGLRWNGRGLRRFTIAILCASIAGDLYYGAERLRVYGIGPHLFFEWRDNQHRIDSGFLKNMHVGGGMIQVQRDVAEALKANPGPYFFGPRVDYNYAVFGIPSPKQFPAWWHPGTAFPISAESKIIDQWKQDHFQTLIFIKGDFAGYDRNMSYTYYPQEFMDSIKNDYVADERYPTVTVFHRR